MKRPWRKEGGFLESFEEEREEGGRERPKRRMIQKKEINLF